MQVDTKQKNVPVWIVSSLHENGNWILRSICLDQRLAGRYRKGILTHHGVVNAWVRETTANHLYGEIFKLTG